jgi:hypothetical protein
MTTVFKNALASSIGVQLTVTAVSASTPSSGSVTFTFADQGTAPFLVGQNIFISGVSVSGYNGTFAVTACTATTVTITNSTTGAATGGTISLCALTTNSSARTTVIGLSLTNRTSNVLLASVQLNDTVVGTTAYYVSNIVVPPNTSARVINGGERLVLGPSTNVLIWGNQASSLDLVMSWVEIS